VKVVAGPAPVAVGEPVTLDVGAVRCLASSADGRRLAVATDDEVWILRSENGTWSRRSTLRPRGGGRHLSCLAVSADGEEVAGGRADGSVFVWLTDAGKLLLRVAQRGPVVGVALHAGIARLASAAGDGTVTIWDLDTGRPLLELQHGARIHAVAMSLDGCLVATAGHDGRVGVWEVVTGDRLRWLEHPRAVHDVTFDREGACLLTAGSDGWARVWNVRTGDVKLVVRHRRTVWDRAVRCAAFSPEADRLVTCGRDRTVRVWNAASGRPILQVRHTAPTDAVAFGPEGRTVLARGDTLRAWVVPADGGELVRMAVRVPTKQRVSAAVGAVVEVVVVVATVVGTVAAAVGVAGLAAFAAWVLFADTFGPWIVDDVVRDEGGTILEAGVLDLGRDDEVRVGDCLVEDVSWLTRWLVAWIEDWYGDPIVGVPCQEPHDLEVFAVAALPDALGHDALDQAAIDAEARLLCDARLAEDLGRGAASSALSIVTWAPTPDSWRDGHREVECWLTRRDSAKLEGSVRDQAG
jgi:hypothetical protein